MNPPAIIPLAWRNLVENKRKLLNSVAGTAFAVTLMFMENGFRHAMLDSMVNVIERLDGEIMLVSRTLYTLAVPIPFPLGRLTEARGVSEVIEGIPVYIMMRDSYWRDPRDGSQERVCVIGVPIATNVLDLPEVQKAKQELELTGTAMADSLSREANFGRFTVGEESELAGRKVRIVGTFKLGINSQSNGNLVTSDRNFLRYFPEHLGASERENGISVGVLRLHPNSDPERVREALESVLPADVRVLTRDEFITRERDFWDKVAPIGTVFLIGVVMGFIVGSVICYQVLFSEVSDRLAEYATLKAMGYSNGRLFRVVVTQAVYLAVMGYLAGLLVSLLLSRWVHEATGLPMDITRNNPMGIFLLSLVMCICSGAYAARKLVSVDPATLFA